MTVDEWVKIGQAVTALIQAVAWPLLLLIVLLFFRDPLKTFITNLSELSFKAGVVEASAKRQVIDATANLSAAAAEAKDGGAIVHPPSRIADLVNSVANPRTIRKLQGSHVLWVDDKPNNNRYERQSFQALGVAFDTSTSTEEAIQSVGRARYNVIISDMGRPEGKDAGYTLLRRLREMGNTTPFIIYSASSDSQHKADAKAAGAFGQTNNPSELFALVIDAIQYGS